MWSGVPVAYSINQSMAQLLWKRLIICEQGLGRINSRATQHYNMALFFILKLDRILAKGKEVKTVYDLQRCEPGNYELFCLLSWCH